VIAALINLSTATPYSFRSDNGNSGTYVALAGGLATSGASRIEFAIAPSNSNIIYACAADGADNLKNVYQSTDRGNTWTVIGAGTGAVASQFHPLSNLAT